MCKEVNISCHWGLGRDHNSKESCIERVSENRQSTIQLPHQTIEAYSRLTVGGDIFS